MCITHVWLLEGSPFFGVVLRVSEDMSALIQHLQRARVVIERWQEATMKAYEVHCSWAPFWCLPPTSEWYVTTCSLKSSLDVTSARRAAGAPSHPSDQHHVARNRFESAARFPSGQSLEVSQTLYIVNASPYRIYAPSTHVYTRLHSARKAFTARCLTHT